MSEIFREIDEELRRDNLAKLWEKYGAYVIGLAVVIVVVTAGIVGWREYQARERRAESVVYASALELARAGDDGKAADAFADIAQRSAGGTKLLARFEAAAARVKVGDVASALATYESIAGDTSIDQAYRDLATILGALQGLSTVEPKLLIERVKPFAGGIGPWRATALEITAVAKLKAGDTAGALEAYKTLSDDLATPSSMRTRATEMISALGG